MEGERKCREIWKEKVKKSFVQAFYLIFFLENGLQFYIQDERKAAWNRRSIQLSTAKGFPPNHAPIPSKSAQIHQISELTPLILAWPLNPPQLNSSPQTSLEGLALGNGNGRVTKTPGESNTSPERQKGAWLRMGLWSQTLRANEGAPGTPNFAALLWHVNILHQEVVLLFQLLSAPNTRNFLP